MVRGVTFHERQRMAMQRVATIKCLQRKLEIARREVNEVEHLLAFFDFSYDDFRVVYDTCFVLNRSMRELVVQLLHVRTNGKISDAQDRISVKGEHY